MNKPNRSDAPLRRLSGRARDQRIPLSGSMAITHACNLKCCHCYHPKHRPEQIPPELSTDKITDIATQARDAGCLYVTITGGEPLTRPDFPDIYTRLKRLGLLVTVFTNGTLITPETAELFAEYPPHYLELTLYGASESTYESVTGVGGSYDRFLTGITHLRNRNIRFLLKSILLTLNYRELEEMHRFSEQCGSAFYIDTGLFPRLDADKAPTRYRLSPEQAVSCDFFFPDAPKRMHEKIIGTQTGIPPRADAGSPLFTCGCGRSTFHIDASGRLFPCTLYSWDGYDLTAGSLIDGWRQMKNFVLSYSMPIDYPCLECDARPLCIPCPVISKLETGRFDTPSPAICAAARERYRATLEFAAKHGFENGVMRNGD